MLTEKIQLETNEKILIQVRKHWFILLVQLLSVLFISVIPFVLYFTLLATAETLSSFLLEYVPVFVTLGTAWLLVMWMALFNVWTNYYLDVWTITTKRLIAVDQRGLFYRNTGSFRLERLQDINISIRGIIATFLNFGDLEAQTASEDREFVARNIPHPRELKALILDATDKTTYGAIPDKFDGTEV
ncbi:MAG: PH domain-containing protein [Candidatus Pacebacteria bacterium]|nr:PH domain-containing protein [Candidatus Paceibacterota bacterium]MCF7857207.1 PH domain-containing protein [Candidatus Paceibacterota bacterium]